MASYVVMEPPSGRPEDAVLVRDGFHLLAFLIPFLWMLLHRLWLEAAAFFVLALALGWLGSLDGFGAGASLLSLLVAIYAGLEGASLRVAALRRRGWREWGVVEADGREDAEIRYLTATDDNAQEQPPIERPRASSPAQPPRMPPRQGPALGMFSYPGRS